MNLIVADVANRYQVLVCVGTASRMMLKVVQFKMMSRIGNRCHCMIPTAFGAAETVPDENIHANIVTDILIVGWCKLPRQ